MYTQYVELEEGCVEMLAQEICKRNNVAYDEAYLGYVHDIKRIKNLTCSSEDDYDFIKKIFDIPVDKRYSYFKELVDGFENRNMSIRWGIHNELQEILKRMRGIRK